MAHFAQLNEDNIVQTVIVVADECAPTEEAGIDFITNTLNLGGVWKQTSYNTYRDLVFVQDLYEPTKIVDVEDRGSKHRNNKTPFRAKYACIGDRYDEANDIFIPSDWSYDSGNDKFIPPTELYILE